MSNSGIIKKALYERLDRLFTELENLNHDSVPLLKIKDNNQNVKKKE